MKRGIVCLFLILLMAIACEPEQESSGSDADAVFARFLESWSDPTDGRFARSITGEDADRLKQAVETLNTAGLEEATFIGDRGNGRRAASGILTLHFADAGTVRLRSRASVVDERILAKPELISTSLRGWETLEVQTFGSHRRGRIFDRKGELLADETREQSRSDLMTAIRLIDRSLGVAAAGAPGHRLLAGSPPRVIAESQPVDGADARTSLDPELQEVAVQVMRSREGALVALDPATGGIRALISTSFQSDRESSPASDAHSPGSTFKLITAAGALESGAFEPDDQVPCPPSVTVGSGRISNFRGEGSGSYTFEGAFAHSCNTAFATIGIRTGIVPILETADSIGFGKRGPAGAEESVIVVPRSPESLAQLSIGAANVELTPIHLAGIAATIANGGLLVTPNWKDSYGKSVRVLKSKTASQLLTMMEANVREGTGQRAAIGGFQLAGKTGTAERTSTEVSEVNDAWFVVLAPSRPARIVIVVFLPGAGVGGQVAAPVAREFLDATKAGWQGPD